MLGTLLLIIASFILIILLTAITEIIANWWAYLLIGLASVALVMYDSYKNKKR